LKLTGGRVITSNIVVKIKKTLILGLGNDILTDDRIGSQLVRDLSQFIESSSIDFGTACCGGLEIMEYIKGYEKVVFIDSIRTRQGKPGDVYYFMLSDFHETSHLSNLHDINFLAAIKLGNTLEMDLPSDLHIIAVEIIEDMEFSEEFTPQLKEKYPEILKEVVTIVRQITN
jgi:hydrogenase maturation protease